MSSPKTKKNITLKTSNGETFEVHIDVISQSQTIKHMIKDDYTNEFILVPNVEGKVLAKVIEYCEKHYKSTSTGYVNDDEKSKNDIREWDIEFMNNMKFSSLMFLVLAANCLEIKSLLDLTTQKIANVIKDKTVEEVREIFNIKDGFTLEEEEKLKKELGWSSG